MVESTCYGTGIGRAYGASLRRAYGTRRAYGDSTSIVFST